MSFEQQKSALVVMTNRGNGEGIFEDVLETLLKDTFTPIGWEGYVPFDELPPLPPLKPHQQIAVDGKSLDRYVGRYRIPPNTILRVRPEGDHLSVKENDEPKHDLMPESETDFVSARGEDRYTFEINGEGKVTTMIPRADGKDIPIQRIG